MAKAEPFRIDPIKLCCGRALSDHLGSEYNICPDLKVMCCICFNRVTIDQLTTEPDGCKVDVCMSCTVDEAAAKFQLLLVKNGALILFPDPDLIDSDSERNVFNYE